MLVLAVEPVDSLVEQAIDKGVVAALLAFFQALDAQFLLALVYHAIGTLAHREELGGIGGALAWRRELKLVAFSSSFTASFA